MKRNYSKFISVTLVLVVMLAVFAFPTRVYAGDKPPIGEQSTYAVFQNNSGAVGTQNEVYTDVYVKSTDYEFQNIVFYCSDRPLTLDRQFVSIEIFPDKATPILTDNYNPVESLTIANAEAFRKSMQSFGKVVLH